MPDTQVLSRAAPRSTVQPPWLRSPLAESPATQQALELVTRFADEAAARTGRPLAVMEVCGGHTHALLRSGLAARLPPSIELVHGPGCPVCVLPPQRIDAAIALAEAGVTVATYGDALRAPGQQGSLEEARARGADVRAIYSPLDALSLADRHPDREVVLFALGFETTAPATAWTLLEAHRRRLRNLTLLSAHVLLPPVLEALLGGASLRLDGLLGPGHVATVIGTRPFEFVAQRHARPFVVCGFTPEALLLGLMRLTAQLRAGEARVENCYPAAVHPDGNHRAQRAVDEVLMTRAVASWRGLGALPASGLNVRPHVGELCAERRYGIDDESPGSTPQATDDPEGCICSEVLLGRRRPQSCALFGTRCTLASPIGACMGSQEGACAAAAHLAPSSRSPGLPVQP